ncbi:hypothetical protein AWB78_08179 [Caballeronia calidae]|uniref:OmpR/PhoB-type domain-containing protein n=1 Tax=Caballeronia calidae TaxID=1777139 RepID=A0A158EIL9_9BURK|nr:winged helix-turn-helix domain-containing protein [Caballeronia calidae]SAL06664.1 hypothetical protein AWB78_08179 [Caballeronia calidae]
MTTESSVSGGQSGFILGSRIFFDTGAGWVQGINGTAGRIELDTRMTRVLAAFACSPFSLLSFEHLIRIALDNGPVQGAHHELSQIIRALRHALHNIDPSSIYIARIPRLGYALVAPVTEQRIPGE